MCCHHGGGDPIKAIFCLLFATLVTGCATQKPVQRYAWITGLKPEKAAYYEKLHAAPWPGVNKMLKAVHIQNFSIHEREIDGKLRAPFDGQALPLREIGHVAWFQEKWALRHAGGRWQRRNY